MDITEINSVESYFLEHKSNYVVHCAAISNVGLCEKEQELSWKVNVIGTENIVKYPNPRNLTMSQEKLNRHGIYFSTTEEGILRVLNSQEVS